ncbi:uncharacterized protein QC761_0010410 [Podospora bellae-mahoneyi]|uniref:Uncharacterized protein n=1 Tax=Podospora bellae-mahoneyi TaxID=2093777 RepID=A0ABR0FWQ4_9PEZI|nr:hypothetical protein QC761_0010410 [Podospora bellae-mahoneyi]
MDLDYSDCTVRLSCAVEMNLRYCLPLSDSCPSARSTANHGLNAILLLPNPLIRNSLASLLNLEPLFPGPHDIRFLFVL